MRRGTGRREERPQGVPSLAAGAASVLLVLVVGAGLRYALQILLARWAGAAEFGLYSLAWSWAFLLALVAGLGLPTTLLRLVPEYLEGQVWPLLRGLLRRSRILVSIAGTALAAAGSLALFVWPSDDPRKEIVRVGLWLVPLIALVELQTEALRGTKRMVSAYAPPHILRPALVLGGAGLLATSGALSAETILLLTGAALLATALVQGWRIRQVLPAAAREAPPVTRDRQWLSVALPLLLVAFFHVILDQADVLVLGAWRPADEVGVYVGAARSATLVGFLFSAVGAIAAPMIAGFHARGESERLERMARRATRWMFWPSLAVALVLGLVASRVLALFGEEFTQGVLPLRVLLVGHLANAGAGPVAYLLMLTGHERACARVYGWSAAIHVLLNVALVSRLGFLGAAIATATSMVVWNVWLSVMVWRRLGIPPLIVPRHPARGTDHG